MNNKYDVMTDINQQISSESFETVHTSCAYVCISFMYIGITVANEKNVECSDVCVYMNYTCI